MGFGMSATGREWKSESVERRTQVLSSLTAIRLQREKEKKNVI